MSQNQGINQTIDGKVYIMHMLPPLESNDLLIDVMKMIGPSLGAFFDSVSKGKGGFDFESELGPDFFTNAASSLFKSLDKTTVRNVINAFAKVTIVEGSGTLDQTLAIHFAGRLPALYKWIAWGMRVQWGGLASALRDFLPARGADKTGLSLSQFPTG